MKKTIMALAFIFAASTVAMAQDTAQKASGHQHKMGKTQKYTCSMHPEVVMDKPGKCPKCGMALVKMKNKKSTKAAAEMKM